MVVVAQIAQSNEDLIACSVLLPVISLSIVLLYSRVTRNLLNPFKQSRISHCYLLNLSISILMVVGWHFLLLFQS